MDTGGLLAGGFGFGDNSDSEEYHSDMESANNEDYNSNPFIKRYAGMGNGDADNQSIGILLKTQKT